MFPNASLLREKIENMVWDDVMLLICYVGCLLTPIEIGIIQEIHWDSALFVFLFLCDGVSLFDVYFSLQQNIFSPFQIEFEKEKMRLDKLYARGNENDKRNGKDFKENEGPSKFFYFFRFLATNKIENKFKIFLRCMSAAPFFVLPLAELNGLTGKSF